MINFSIKYASSVEVQMETWLICRRIFCSQTMQILVISRCCFEEDNWELYTETQVLSCCSTRQIFYFATSSLPSR